MDYSVIGREAPSICELLDIEKVAHWVHDIQMPTVDEEGASICTNADMLRFVYGKLGNTCTAELKDKIYDDNKISPEKHPYLSESAVFYSDHQSDIVSGSTMDDSNFQVLHSGWDNTQDVTKNKCIVESEQMNYYKQDTPGSHKDTVSIDHENQVVTNSTDKCEAKQSESIDDVPIVPLSEDVATYATSGSSLSTPDGSYTAIHPGDQITSSIPPTTSHHSDQSMPFGEYLDTTTQK